MLGEPSHLGSDLVLRIGEELQRRQLSSLQVRPLLDYTTTVSSSSKAVRLYQGSVKELLRSCSRRELASVKELLASRTRLC